MDFTCFSGGSKNMSSPNHYLCHGLCRWWLFFKINLEIIQADGTWEDYFEDFDSIDGVATENSNEETDKSDSFLNKRIPVSMRVESIITTPDMNARILLIESVSEGSHRYVYHA